MLKEERFNTFSHLLGGIAGIGCTILLVYASLGNDILLTILSALAGISVTLLFFASSLFHATKISTEGPSFWLKVDHAAIFMMIIGSYGAPLYIYAPARVFIAVFGAVLFFCCAGITIKLNFPDTQNWINVVIYAPIGLISLYPIITLWRDLDSIPLELVNIPLLKTFLLSGLILYTLGGIIYAIKKPNPRPGLPGFHEIFHVCVVLGASLHFLALYYSIKAYPVIQEWAQKMHFSKIVF